MTPKIIVSYDDSANDRDAVALGRLLSDAGASFALAYVRHGHEADPDREQIEQHAAEELLERGAVALGRPDADRLVVEHASTAEGLRELAIREHADLLVFGSDYRTPVGKVQPGTSAQRLLEGGPVAIAIAPSGLHQLTDARIGAVGLLAGDGDDAAVETAEGLARSLGGELVGPGGGKVDLLVVGSRREAQAGHVTLSGEAQHAIDTAECAVLAVPRGRAIDFHGSLAFA